MTVRIEMIKAKALTIELSVIRCYELECHCMTTCSCACISIVVLCSVSLLGQSVSLYNHAFCPAILFDHTLLQLYHYSIKLFELSRHQGNIDFIRSYFCMDVRKLHVVIVC